jgi:hypothetical protein
MRRRTIASTASVLALTGGLFAFSTGVSQAATFTVDDTADTLDEGTLRAAVIAANGNGAADVINLVGGTTYTLSLVGADDTAAAGDLDITSAVTINGNGATVDANDIDRAFHVLPGGSLTLNDVNIVDGLADDGGELGNSGGGILTQGALTMNGGSISDSSAVRAGGGIEANRGPGVEGLTPVTILDGVTLADNSTGATPGNGGAFHITGPGTTTISDSSITGNAATNEGGGVWNSAAGQMIIANTDISDNAVTVGATLFNGGGGVFQQGAGTNNEESAALGTGNLVIVGGSITGNTATASALSSGGGVLNIRGTVLIEGTTISGNSSARAGGGIEINGQNAPGTSTTLDGVTLADNTTGPTPGNGGGLHITGPGSTDITDSVVSGNDATNEGGGVWNSSAGTMTITDTEISDNDVTVGATMFNGGGGVFQQGGGTNDAPAAATGSIAIRGGSITGNTATGSGPSSGGGVLNVRGDVTITDTVIAGNDASRAGGGIEASGNAVDPANTTLIGVVLADNSTGASPGNGGGFHLTGPGATDVVDSTVTGNVAANEGGGLWNSAVGEMTVSGTLLADNVANGDGTENGAEEGGGGLFNDGGTLEVFDSTVSGNAAPNGAGGGVLDVNGTITLIGVTVTDNTSPLGAGVFGFESPQLETVVFGNSIIAGNNGDDCGGSLESLGGNVLGAGCADVASDTVTDDPELGALADNGGPTLTHLPAQGSPAIDSGLAELCSETDQRGTARPIDGDGNGVATCDAGAVEAAFIATPANPGTPPAAPPAAPVTANPTFTG